MSTCIKPVSYDNYNALQTLGGTSDWPENVPQQSREDYEANGLAIARDEFEPCWNNVVTALLNKIGLTLIKTATMNDPLASFRSGDFGMGESIEEIFVGQIKAQVYNTDTGADDFFKKESPNVDTMFHRNRRREKYPMTIFEDDLKKAFRTEYGLSTLINSIIAAINESNIRDQYIWSKQVLRKYIMTPDVPHQSGQLREVAFPTGETASKAFLKALKKGVRDLSFNSTKYNPKKAAQRTPTDQMALFVYKDVLNEIEIDALMGAFNLGYALPEIPIIALDNFGGDLPGVNTLAMLTDRRFFMIYNQMMKNGTPFPNGDNLSLKIWLHVWEMYCASYFHNVILFNCNEPVTYDDDGLTP